MERIADDVFRIPLTPRDVINAYLLGDVLVDAGTRISPGTVLGALKGRSVREHALTHAHNDHVGGSSKVVEELGLEGVAVGAADAEATRTGKVVLAPHTPLKPVAALYGGWPKVPVARELREGDEVGPGFVVLDVPGHSPGHVAFWRESDGVLIAGDVFFGMQPFTLRSGVRDPVRSFTVDPDLNKRSQRKLAALEPKVTGFGHGPLLRDPAVLARVAQS